MSASIARRVEVSKSKEQNKSEGLTRKGYASLTGDGRVDLAQFESRERVLAAPIALRETADAGDAIPERLTGGARKDAVNARKGRLKNGLVDNSERRRKRTYEVGLVKCERLHEFSGEEFQLLEAEVGVIVRTDARVRDIAESAAGVGGLLRRLASRGDRNQGFRIFRKRKVDAFWE